MVRRRLFMGFPSCSLVNGLGREGLQCSVWAAFLSNSIWHGGFPFPLL